MQIVLVLFVQVSVSEMPSAQRNIEKNKFFEIQQQHNAFLVKLLSTEEIIYIYIYV